MSERRYGSVMSFDFPRSEHADREYSAHERGLKLFFAGTLFGVLMTSGLVAWIITNAPLCQP